VDSQGEDQDRFPWPAAVDPARRFVIVDAELKVPGVGLGEGDVVSLECQVHPAPGGGVVLAEQGARCFRLALGIDPHGKGEVPLTRAQVALGGYFEDRSPAIEAGGPAAFPVRSGSVKGRPVVGGVVPLAGMVADITGQWPVRDQPFVAAWLALAV